MRTIDEKMSKACNNVMSAQHSMLDSIQYTNDDISWFTEDNPEASEREDVKACRAIMTEFKAVINEYRTKIAEWQAHFDGVTPDNTGEANEAEN